MPIPTLAVGKVIELPEAYKTQSRARDFWQRSDRCRWDYARGYDATGEWAILPKHEREPDDRFRRRSAQAMPRRYVRPILDRYNDHVCRQDVERPTGPDPYETLKLDADGTGTPLPVLMQRGLRMAQRDGLSYLLADVNDPATYATAAQDASAGKRGILRITAADQVIGWRDHAGHVVEAIIACTDADGDFLWRVTDRVTQRIEIDKPTKQQIRVVSIGPEIPHAYGGCPLVRILPVWDEDMAIGDDSQSSPLSEAQKRIINIDSWLYEELQGGTFTTPVIIGASREDLQNSDGSAVVVGPGNGLIIPSPNAKLDKIGSDVAQAGSLRDQLNYEIAELYRVAGLTPGNPTQTGQPESGVAKAFAFNEIEAKLAALATAAQTGENRAIKLLSTAFWSGVYPGDANWPVSFAAPDLAAELEYTIRLMGAPGMPRVLKEQQIKGFAAQAFKLAPGEKAELETQIEEAAEQQAEADASPFSGTSTRRPEAGTAAG